jgi:hypothetical protein
MPGRPAGTGPWNPPEYAGGTVRAGISGWSIRPHFRCYRGAARASITAVTSVTAGTRGHALGVGVAAVRACGVTRSELGGGVLVKQPDGGVAADRASRRDVDGARTIDRGGHRVGLRGARDHQPHLP